MLPLVILSLILLSAAEWQGEGTQDQECVLLLTSPIFVCDDPISKSSISTDDMDILRPNETLTFVTGQFELMLDVDDLIRVELVVRRNHMTMLTLEVDVCKEISLGEKSDYYKLLKFITIPASCPIDPGKYTVKDLPVNLEDLPINSLNIGDYDATVNIKRCKDKNCNQSKFLGSLILTFVIEPV